MDSEDVSTSEEPEPRRKSDQEIFDEQIARASGKLIVQIGGIGILFAVAMSIIALVVSVNNSNTTTVTVPAATTATTPAQLTGDALGQQIFVSGTPGGAVSCGSCHTMAAAGSTGMVGPNLDKELTMDPASATRESIVTPNKEIVPGYRANVMPSNYATALTPQELNAVVKFVYDSTNVKAKKASKTSTTG